MSEFLLEGVAEKHELHMRELLYGQLISRSLAVAAELGVPDLLATGARSPTAVAEALGAHPESIRRLLTGLAAYGVFVADEAGRFALTPRGATLRAQAPGTAHPTALLVGREVGATWAELGTTMRTGKPAFDQALSSEFFKFLADRPQTREVFHQSQSAAVAAELSDLFDQIDVRRYRQVVDIGGGDGSLLCVILEKATTAKGVVFDLPEVREHADARIADVGLTDRCSTAVGDFFEAVPRGGDLYILSRILHDWSDEDAVRILRTCHASMGAGSSLLILEYLLDERSTGAPARAAAVMDLYMLSLFGATGGHERTAAEFGSLLERAGFVTTRQVSLRSGVAAIEAAPAAERVAAT
jgi:hypothetical protein